MSYDIKYRDRALSYLSEGHSYRKTAEVFKVSPSTLQAWKSRLKESDTLAPKQRKETWRKIDPDKLRKYVDEHPDAYRDEIAEAFGVRSYAIQRARKRLKITCKKTTLYKESKESFRQSFVEKLKDISSESLVYVDECGIEQYLYREYAYSLRGQKVMAKMNGRKFKRTNIVAGLCQGNWVAPMEYGGTTDSTLFEYWFENCLLEEVNPGSVIVLDNATFHKKSVIPDIAKTKGGRLLFLPPYSPDLNPIEIKWTWLKKKLRNILSGFDSFDRALLFCFYCGLTI